MEPTTYPLAWPNHKPRTASNKRRAGLFKSTKQAMTVALACDRVLDQLEALNAGSVVISTNVQPTLAGRPRSGQSAPSDPGAAVYCSWRGKPLVFACDTFNELPQNLAAIAAHIEALRGQERWGVASLEQAFMGHMQLPGRRSCWDVLGLPEGATEAQIRAAHKGMLANHPDLGGDTNKMAEINAARDEALKLLEGAK